MVEVGFIEFVEKEIVKVFGCVVKVSEVYNKVFVEYVV